MPQRQQPQSHSHATHTTKSRCAHDDSAAPLSWTRLVLPGTRPRAAQNRVPGPPALATCACRRLGRLHTATRSAHSQTRVAWRGWRGTYMHSQCAGPHRRPQHGDTHGSGSVPPARRFIRVVACAHSVPIRAHAARQRHAATAACHIAAAAHDRCGSVLAKLLHLHARGAATRLAVRHMRGARATTWAHPPSVPPHAGLGPGSLLLCAPIRWLG